MKTKLSGALQSGICSLQFARWHFQSVDQLPHTTGGLGSARYTGQGATHPGCTTSSCRQRLTVHTVLAFALGSLDLRDANTWGSHHHFSTLSQPKSASHLPQNQDYSRLRAYLGTDAPHPEASCHHAIPPGSGCNPPTRWGAGSGFPQQGMNIHFSIKSRIRTSRQVILRPDLQREFCFILGKQSPDFETQKLP